MKIKANKKERYYNLMFEKIRLECCAVFCKEHNISSILLEKRIEDINFKLNKLSRSS